MSSVPVIVFSDTMRPPDFTTAQLSASELPPKAAYNRAFQARLADEIQRLPPGAALERAMLDYARLRDQARACHKVK